MTNYFFQKVTGGYHWNMLQRIKLTLGFEPAGSGTIGEETYITFLTALTDEQYNLLAALMNDNPTLPPSTGVGLQFRDVWEEFELFRTEAQLPNLQLYFVESVPGSGKIDRGYLWHPTPLTNTQKNRVKNAYINLFLS